MTCPRCQQDNPSHANFCLGCGVSFKGADGSSPPIASYADLQRSLGEALEREAGAVKREAEAQEQQAATSAILWVISRSQTDVQPVLDAVAENAARVCGANDAIVLRLDGDMVQRVAHFGEVPSVVAPYRLGPGTSVAAQAMTKRRTIHVSDTHAAVDQYPVALASGARTVLATPLLREGAPIGALALRRMEVRPFTHKQVALLEIFAAQAVIAIENVRLFKELQARNRDLTTALEQQTATSEILRVISQSPTDAQPVFETIARNAVRLCGATSGGLYLFDGELVHSVANEGYTPEQLAQWRSTFPRPLTHAGVSSVAIRTRAVVRIADVEATPGLKLPGEIITNLRSRGTRSLLSVPMLRQNDVIGAISLAERSVAAFSDTHVELLKTFADQAVIAIENVRLFKELQQKNEALTHAHAQVSESLDQQTATGEILRVISSAHTDPQPVFETIVKNAVKLCNGAVAAVFRTDGTTLYHPANYGAAPEAMASVRAQYPRPLDMTGTPGIAILTRSVVHVPDTEDASAVEQVRQTGRHIGFRSVVTVPMMRSGEAVGAITVGRREPGRFSDAEVELLKTFADQAVIAIENVRLFTELQTSNRELTTALDTQTATSDILRVISRSQTDVQPVFDAIVASAVRLLEADSGLLTRIAGDHIEIAALTSTDPAGDAILRAAYPLSRHSDRVHARVIRDRAPLNVADAQTDPRLPDVQHATARARGYRSQVAVPLLRHDEALGAIAVTRHVPGGFTDDEIALLKTFADQAVIAIENSRLLTELQQRNEALTQAHAQVTEALEQQTATSEILRVISQSPTDTQPVFDAIVERALRLSEATVGAVTIFDGELIHVAASNLRSDSPILLVFPMRPSRAGSLAARTVFERQIIHVPDALAEPEYNVAQHAAESGYRSVLSVPMLREGAVVGTITVGRSQAGRYLDRQIALLQTFADQAVIAIENVRLFKELEARTLDLTRSVGELRALGEVGQAISSTLDLQTVLSTIVARATQLSGTDAGVIYEYDDQREVFVPRATEHLEAGIVETMLATPVRKGEGATGRLAEAQEPIQLPDILAVPAESRVRGALVGAGYRALLAVPLIREGHLIGGLTVIRRATGAFAPEVVDLMRTFATQSALAIQNARLFLEIEDKSRQLEAASQHKSEFLANMSHELRTPMNAILGFSEVLAEGMFGEINDKQAEYLSDILESGRHLLSLINDILDLSKIEAGRMELEPTDFDLPGAIDNALTLVRERAGRRGIALGRAIDERVGTIRADERKVKQVLLNLLSNALKFTPEGGRIDVRAAVSDGMVEVSVADTGVGIAPEDQEAVFEEFRQVGTADKKVEGTGLGLALSRKFIELHGGSIWVKSQVGQGSTFTFTIPVRRG